MATPEASLMVDDVPHCAHCGGVIGVYEPATRVVGSLAVATSRAADPGLTADSPGLLYHAGCYELARRCADP